MLCLSACCYLPVGLSVPAALPQSSSSEATAPLETETSATTGPEATAVEEPTQLQDDEFVPAVDHVPHLRVELAYATEDNFTGQKIYSFTQAYLRYGTAKKLASAAQSLALLGYGLVIWDGYRPVYAQQLLWNACPDPAYVSPPGTGNQSHCRGIAVDVTLYELSTGRLLEMPTGFDDFTDLADREYTDCTAEAANNAALLEQIMEECGFLPYSAEWWHFSDTDTYPIEYDFDPALIN